MSSAVRHFRQKNVPCSLWLVFLHLLALLFLMILNLQRSQTSMHTVKPARLRSRTLTLTGAHLFALLALLSGCWGSSDPELEPEQEAKELRTDKDPLATEVPEAELTRLAKQLYQVGMYSVARDSFGSLKDRYPMGAHAGFAELKYADTFFFNSEFNQAAKSYEDYLKNYPGSSDAPYCKLQAARSHVASARNDGRDRQPWERALTIYDEIVSAYPSTAYADVAGAERVQVVKELSAYDRDIIEFYRKNDNTAAVEERERKFQERWGMRLSEIEGAEQANTRGADSRPLRELPAVTAALRSVEAYPDTSSDQLLAAESVNSGQTTQEATTPLVEGRIAVQGIQCRNEGNPFATVELTKLPEKLLTSYSETQLLTPTDGVVLISDLGITARQVVWDCFGSADLMITPEGDLKLNSQHPISITVLEDPPRILLSPAKGE
jgi:outer membrane assembly lipoprotein YfiO